MTTATSSDERAIEAKLSGLDAKLRQERERARRNRQVMEEKCHMVQGELDTVKQQIDSLRNDLQKIVTDTPKEEQLVKEKQTVQRLSTEVSQCVSLEIAIVEDGNPGVESRWNSHVSTYLPLTTIFLLLRWLWQVRFQHSELLHKLDKIQQVRQRLDKEGQERRKILEQLEVKVQHRRKRASFLQEQMETRQQPSKAGKHNDTIANPANKNAAIVCLQDDIAAEKAREEVSDEQVAEKWINLIAIQTQRFQQQTQRLERTNLARLKRIAAGYHHHFATLLDVEEDCRNGNNNDVTMTVADG